MERATDPEEGVGMGKRLNEWVTGSILFAIVMALAIGAYARNSFWKSEIELWKDCVKKAPHKERTHHNLGYAYYEGGLLEEAQEEFGKALTLNPIYPLSWYNLGLVYYRKGMMEEAIDCNKKALDLNGYPPETYYNLGLAYYQKGLYPNAIEALEAFLEAKPENENAYNHLGLAYQRLKQWGKATESFQEGLRRNPENPYTHLYLGDLYYELKDYAKTLAHFKKALNCPNLPEAKRIQKIVLSIEMKNRGKDKKGIS